MIETTARNERPKSRTTTADSYDNIEPWFDRLAELDTGDAHRLVMRNKVLQLCMPLADHIARRFAGRGEEFDDLQQVARLGLIQAVDRFDVHRGSSFLAFAVPTIMGEVRRHFRDRAWSVRVPRGLKEIHGLLNAATEALSQRFGRAPTARELAAELDVDLYSLTQALVARNSYRAESLDRLTRVDGQNTPLAVLDGLGADEPCYALIEDAMVVRPLLAALPERERHVLTLRFFGYQTQAQIADRLGVSQMQISRILSSTLNKLRAQALGECSDPAQ